eukprot:2528098-Rhodomonas_salina.1
MVFPTTTPISLEDLCCDCERSSCNGHGTCDVTPKIKECKGAIDCRVACNVHIDVAVLMDNAYLDTAVEGANMLQSVNAGEGLVAVSYTSVNQWISGLSDASSAVVPELDKVPRLNSEKNEKIYEWVYDGGTLVSATDDFGDNNDFLNAIFGWNTKRKYLYGGEWPRQPAAEGTCFDEQNGSPDTLPNLAYVTYNDRNRLPSGAEILYSDGARQVSVWRIAVGDGWVYMVGYDWNAGADASWDWVLQTALTCDENAYEEYEESSSGSSEATGPDEDTDT